MSTQSNTTSSSPASLAQPVAVSSGSSAFQSTLLESVRNWLTNVRSTCRSTSGEPPSDQSTLTEQIIIDYPDIDQDFSPYFRQHLARRYEAYQKDLTGEGNSDNLSTGLPTLDDAIAGCGLAKGEVVAWIGGKPMSRMSTPQQSQQDWHRFKLEKEGEEFRLSQITASEPIYVTVFCRGHLRKRIVKHPPVPDGFRPVVEGETILKTDLYFNTQKQWSPVPDVAVGVIVGPRATLYFARKKGEFDYEYGVVEED